MKRSVFGKSVRGSSHEINGKPCQDACRFINKSNEFSIIAVADGHGSDSCTYSDEGAKIAVRVFCNVLRKICSNQNFTPEMLYQLFSQEGNGKIAKRIVQEWKEEVSKEHRKKEREMTRRADGKWDKNKALKLYGTTLLGMVIFDEFYFAFQIGDGDIACVSDSGFSRVIQEDKILGTETYSLCDSNVLKCVKTNLQRVDFSIKTPMMFMLTSDGFVNSYVNDSEYQKSCKEYLAMLKEYGPDIISDNLNQWLWETSREGCGDDITAEICYITD